MTELQEARAKWLEAEERILKLQKENGDLLHRNYELQMKLYVAEAQAQCAQAMHEGFVAGLLRHARF